MLIRFKFMLRRVDVYGQWEPSEGREAGIQTDGQIWVDGLTWDRFDSNLTTFSKVINKTRDSMPAPYNFDLTNTPDIRRRLSEIPRDQRTGPVIVLKNGRPPKNHVITRTFKTIVRDTGLPEELQVRDTRSGGITEAKTLVDPYTLQLNILREQQRTFMPVIVQVLQTTSFGSDPSNRNTTSTT